MFTKRAHGSWSPAEFQADMARLGFSKWVQLAKFLSISPVTIRSYAYGRRAVPLKVQTRMEQASEFDPAVRALIHEAQAPKPKRRYYMEEDGSPQLHPPYLFSRSQYELVIAALKAWGERLKHPKAADERERLASLIRKLPKHTPYRVPMNALDSAVMGSALFNLGRTDPRALALYQLYRRNHSTGCARDQRFVTQWSKQRYGI